MNLQFWKQMLQSKRVVLTRKGPQHTQETTVITASCTIISTSNEQNEVEDADDARRVHFVFTLWDFILACSNARPLRMLQSKDRVSAVRPRHEKARTRLVSAVVCGPWIGKKHHVPGN